MNEGVSEQTSPNIPLNRRLLRLLRMRVWIAETLRPSELQVTLFWAGAVGFLGGLSTIAFRRATTAIQWLLTHRSGGFADTFSHLPFWERLIVPCLGGALAGGTLALGMQWARKKSSTDYMEAIVLGDGVISVRSSLTKSLSALFSIASGGSIGREGPLVQLSAMLASVVGRLGRMAVPRLRLIVACGAAAGIASAYNAPIAGAFFVAEIVLGSVAAESFGPLVFASVIATITVRPFIGDEPLYQTAQFRLNSPLEIFPYLILGLASGVAAPWFLRWLRMSEQAFAYVRAPRFARLMLGGAIVGGLAIFQPQVCGNGYSLITSILHGEWAWKALLAVLILKLIATAATFGSGAVGGVFTPTLFVGAAFGYLFGFGVESFWHASSLSPNAFALVGMGAFLAATTHAPIMAIIMLFEMTLDYQIILPLMLACMVGYYTSIGFERRSIYADSLKRKGAGIFEQQLGGLKVENLMKRNPTSVLITSAFDQIAQNFVTTRYNYLYVTDQNSRFAGAISLHDIKNYLNEPEIAEIVTARDLVREDFATLTPDVSLVDALRSFSLHDGERTPVVNNTSERILIGSISKTDLILSMAGGNPEAQPVTG